MFCLPEQPKVPWLFGVVIRQPISFQCLGYRPNPLQTLIPEIEENDEPRQEQPTRLGHGCASIAYRQHCGLIEPPCRVVAHPGGGSTISLMYLEAQLNLTSSNHLRRLWPGQHQSGHYLYLWRTPN